MYFVVTIAAKASFFGTSALKVLRGITITEKYTLGKN